jgi:heme/copper-type cytochrome/quinol oxidase subunit 4
MSTGYVPGTCNIGPAEIKRRQSAAVIGFLAMVILGAILLAQHASTGLRAVIFIPAMLFATGWIQARSKFCLAFGFAGTFNFGKLGELSKIQSAEDKAADRRTALMILGRAFVLAIVLTLIFILL